MLMMGLAWNGLTVMTFMLCVQDAYGRYGSNFVVAFAKEQLKSNIYIGIGGFKGISPITVTIKAPKNPGLLGRKTFTLETASNWKTVKLDDKLVVRKSRKYEGYAITIRSTRAITVRVLMMVLSTKKGSSGAFLVLNVNQISTHYVVKTSCWDGDCFVVVASCKAGTRVQIKLRAVKMYEASRSSSSIVYNGRSYEDGDVFEEVLQAYDVMQLLGNTVDMTGTLISSSEYVAVWSGGDLNRKVDAGNGKISYKLERVIEQLPPIQGLGRKFVLCGPPSSRSSMQAGIMVHVTVPYPDTSHTFRGNNTALIDTSLSDDVTYSFSVNYNDTIILESSKPVLVFIELAPLLGKGAVYDLGSILAMPVESWHLFYIGYIFETSQNTKVMNFLILVTMSTCKHQFQISGKEVVGLTWTKEDDYKSGAMNLTTRKEGSFNISNPFCPFGGYMVGTNGRLSWSFALGWRMPMDNAIPSAIDLGASRSQSERLGVSTPMIVPPTSDMPSTVTVAMPHTVANIHIYGKSSVPQGDGNFVPTVIYEDISEHSIPQAPITTSHTLSDIPEASSRGEFLSPTPVQLYEYSFTTSIKSEKFVLASSMIQDTITMTLPQSMSRTERTLSLSSSRRTKPDQINLSISTSASDENKIGISFVLSGFDGVAEPSVSYEDGSEYVSPSPIMMSQTSSNMPSGTSLQPATSMFRDQSHSAAQLMQGVNPSTTSPVHDGDRSVMSERRGTSNTGKQLTRKVYPYPTSMLQETSVGRDIKSSSTISEKRVSLTQSIPYYEDSSQVTLLPSATSEAQTTETVSFYQMSSTTESSLRDVNQSNTEIDMTMSDLHMSTPIIISSRIVTTSHTGIYGMSTFYLSSNIKTSLLGVVNEQNNEINMTMSELYKSTPILISSRTVTTSLTGIDGTSTFYLSSNISSFALNAKTSTTTMSSFDLANSTQAVYFTPKGVTLDKTEEMKETTQKSNTFTLNLCPCACATNLSWIANLTGAEIEEKSREIARQLHVEKASLSQTIRKKISSNNKEPSSAYFGTLITCVVFVSIMGAVIIPDTLSAMFHVCKLLKKRVEVSPRV